MNSLFGLSMNTIMAWMLAVFLVITGVVVVLAVLNPLFFRLGLRNIPRRRAQTILIIVGLMLSTVIVTSAFSTGDTVSYSIRSATITNLGNIDESVSPTGAQLGRMGGGAGLVASTYLPVAVQQRIATALAGNSNVDGFTGVLARSIPLQDLTSGQTKNQNVLAGIPANYPAAFGPLTTTGGTRVTLSQLRPDEVYLNSQAADSLSARPGDTLQTYVGTIPVRVTVRAILQSNYLASGGLLSNGEAADPTILVPLDRVQRLLGLPGAVTTMLVTNRGDLTGGYSLSDGVTDQLRALLANDAEVTRVKALLASDGGKSALATLIHGQSGSTKTKLQELQTQVALPGVTDALRSLLSDTAVSGPLMSMKAPVQVGAPLNDALASISNYHVEPLKKNGLDAADLFGSFFTTFFVAFSLFSIAAGVMLIFLIFTMLAAERRPEMGMARAVGTKRRHLIQQFLFEGYVYDLGAALIGMILGIGVGLGMVRIMAALLSGISSNFTLVGHVEPRSLVVSFCLGALVTFLTVTFASVRVSRLNVVAAIRDLPESFGVKTDVGHAWEQTRREFGRIFERGQRLRLGLWLLGIVLLLLPGPLRVVGIIYLVLRLAWYCRHLFGAFLSRGLLFLLIGIPLEPVGIKTGQEFFFGLGGSFIVIGLAMLIRWILHFQHVDDAVRNRVGYSLAGIGLVVYWLLPFDFWDRFGVPSLNAGPEMFFVAGILLVIGAVWTVMYNVDVILGGLLAVFGRFGHLAPVIKMAVSYPMQHKFRTGLTLAMFSLVIFTLMFMSAIVGSTSSSLNLDRDTGGYQIFGAANPNNPIQGGVQHAIATNPALKDITATGGIAKLNVGLRQPGKQNQSWQPNIANIVDTPYLASTDFTLHSRANGYGSDARVWQTLRSKPGYAVVDGSIVMDQPGGSTDAGFAIDGAYYEHSTFSPVTIQMRDNATGATFTLTVIGVLDQRAGNLPALTNGVYTGENTLTAAGQPAASPNFFVFRVGPGGNVHATALALGRTFLQNGLDVKESQKQFDSNQAISIGLFDLLEGFMGLGLIVGIAALGVVATRAVVERRQEIGMLRAIGFQRAMIRTTFLLESSFVAILGTLLGIGLGLRVAQNLIDLIAQTNNSVSFTVPWVQILVIVAIAYLASLVTTYLPAWQASRVYPAEALRYE